MFCSKKPPLIIIKIIKNPDLHPDSPTMPVGAPAAGHGQDTHLEAQARNTSEVYVIPEACWTAGQSFIFEHETLVASTKIWRSTLTKRWTGEERCAILGLYHTVSHIFLSHSNKTSNSRLVIHSNSYHIFLSHSNKTSNSMYFIAQSSNHLTFSGTWMIGVPWGRRIVVVQSHDTKGWVLHHPWEIRENLRLKPTSFTGKSWKIPGFPVSMFDFPLNQSSDCGGTDSCLDEKQMEKPW